MLRKSALKDSTAYLCRKSTFKEYPLVVLQLIWLSATLHASVVKMLDYAGSFHVVQH